MEAALKPQVLETLDQIAALYKRLGRLQDAQVEAALGADELSTSQERRFKKLRNETVDLVKKLRLNNNRIEALVDQMYGINRRLSSLEGKLLRLAEAHGVERADFLKQYFGNELDPNWVRRVGRLTGHGLEEFRHRRARTSPRNPRRDPDAGAGNAPGDLRFPPHRADGAEGRARKPPGEEGNDRGQFAPRDFDRQEIHQSRPAIPRSHPGRQYRPDEGGGQIRIPPRLQILDLRDLVDPAGDHALDRRSGAHHPHSRAHDRDHQQAGAHLAPDAARDRPRADAGRIGRASGHAAGKSAQGYEDRQGADFPRNAHRRRRGFASSAISSRTRTRSCPSMPRSSPICARPPRACWRR